MWDIVPVLPGFTTQRTSTTLTGTPVLWIPANPRRPILYVTNPSTQSQIQLNLAFPTVGQPSDFIIPTQSTKVFTWILDGAVPTFGMYAYINGTAFAASFLEVLWLPENLGV